MMHYPPCDWCGECKCCPYHDCEICRKDIFKYPGTPPSEDENAQSGLGFD